jgi:endonuclease/exonuclease/phosphatase family metal-dependent hydrolase
MRVVSLNTWKAEGDYSQRVRAMVDGLADLSADVIALQEDWRTCDSQTHTARSLANALSMHLTWIPARAKLRSFEETSILSTAGLAVLSRAPVLEQRVITLPQDASDGERLAQCVKLPGDEQPWWLVNVHLTHLGHRADLRHAQLQTVLDAMESVAQDGQAVVVCGDFNAEPHDDEIAGFLQANGPLIDAFSGITNKVTHRSETGIARNIDHIFLRAVAGMPAWVVHHARVVMDRPTAQVVLASDHFAVCADLSC